MAHPLLEKAANLVEQARALNDEFADKSTMPAEVAHKIDTLLGNATECRKQVEREARLSDLDGFLREPEYKHDMSGGAAIARDFGHGEALTTAQREERHSKAFFDFVRKGTNALAPEAKADLVENATGELLVPTDYAGTILRELPRQGVIRNLATIRPTSSNKVDVGAVVINAAGWGKLETGTAATDGLGANPGEKDTITVHDLNALVKLGRDELEDSDDNLAEIIRQALALKFGEQEDDAFANGSGTGQPWGIAASADVTQGVAAAAGETVTSDELKKVMFAVPAQFRRNGVWLVHSGVEEAIALLKDGDNRYLLQPNASLGEPSTLFGKPLHVADGLPAMAATDDAGAGTNKSLIFGDVRSGYMIADRRRLTVQRLEERYAEEGKVGLLFTHRVGGDVIRPKAFAWLKL